MEQINLTKERQQGEGQEAQPINGDVHKESVDKNVIHINEHERM